MKSIRVLVSALTLQSALLLLHAQSPVIYSFGGDPDGANPKRSVTLSGSSLYGTTVYGGTGDGTVFQLLSSSGSWSETVLYSFAGGTGDGSYPYAGLLLSGGVFYGTTYYGGTHNAGTVFSQAAARCRAFARPIAPEDIESPNLYVAASRINRRLARRNVDCQFQPSALPGQHLSQRPSRSGDRGMAARRGPNYSHIG
jgi:uncharacterized repeat protein (TIGR03803 family)